MLEFLRKAVKSWVAKIFLGLLIASFAVWGITDVFSFSPGSEVASVGDTPVTVGQYYDELVRQQTALVQMRRQPISFDEMRDFGIGRIALLQMLRERAFAEELASLGIRVPDTAVAEAIRQDPTFRGSGGAFSDTLYRASLARGRYNPSEFEERVRTELGRTILFDAATVAGAEALPPGLATRIASFELEQRQVNTVVLPVEAVAEPGAPSDEALEAHYRAHLADYTEPERRTAVALHVDPVRLAEEARPSEEEVAERYEQERELRAVPPTRSIDQLPLRGDDPEALAERVRSGAISFEDLARELGETPADLDLGTVSQSDLPTAVAEAVFAATEPGIVGPVAAPLGPVLVRVREVSLGGAPALEEVRDEIADALARDAALVRATDLTDRIDDLRAEGQTLEEIAETTGLTLHRIEGLGQDGSLAGGGRAEGFAAMPEVIAEVFEALDLEERDILTTPDGGAFLVFVEEIADARQLPLEDIRDRVTTDWAAAERLAAVAEEARTLAEGLAGEATLADLAAERGLELTEHPPFPRNAPPEALPAGLAAELFAAAEGEAVAAPLASGAGAMIAAVARVVTPEPAALEAATGQVDGMLRRQYADDQRALFSRAIEEQHPRQINEGAVDQVYDMLGAQRMGR